MKITDAQEAKDLIADLKQALKNSVRTQGVYPVYRKDETGEIVLAVSMEIKPKRR